MMLCTPQDFRKIRGMSFQQKGTIGKQLLATL
jgi:hypothetical protein